jgi:hypothetical protein
MIHERDIDLYLRAKQQSKIRKNILLLCVLVLSIWILLRFFGVNNITLDYVTVGLLFGFLVDAHGSGFSPISFVPNSKLLEIIERQINSDPESLKYVISKNT